MHTVTGIHFENQRIDLDYTRWVNCSFVNCEIFIDAGVFHLIDNEFIKNELTVTGSARNILMVADMFSPHKGILAKPGFKQRRIKIRKSDIKSDDALMYVIERFQEDIPDEQLITFYAMIEEN